MSNIFEYFTLSTCCLRIALELLETLYIETAKYGEKKELKWRGQAFLPIIEKKDIKKIIEKYIY